MVEILKGPSLTKHQNPKKLMIMLHGYVKVMIVAIVRLVHVVFAEWTVEGPNWARHGNILAS